MNYVTKLNTLFPFDLDAAFFWCFKGAFDSTLQPLESFQTLLLTIPFCLNQKRNWTVFKKQIRDTVNLKAKLIIVALLQASIFDYVTFIAATIVWNICNCVNQMHPYYYMIINSNCKCYLICVKGIPP